MSAHSDALAVLFHCDTYVNLFPSGMPRRACLRRQLEVDANGKPKRPACASGCPIGAEVLRALEGVPRRVCEKCLALLVGDEAEGPCPTCTARRMERAVPATWFLPPGGAPAQDVIWSGKLPDVPIAPPKATTIGLTAEDAAAAARRVTEALGSPAARARAATPRPAPVAAAPKPPREPPPPPAPRRTCACGCGRELRADNLSGYSSLCGSSMSAKKTGRLVALAEEETMPKGMRAGGPCPKCGSKGTRHLSGCTENGKAPKLPPPPPKAKQAPRLRVAGKFDPSTLTLDELVEHLGACKAELARRADAYEEQAKAARAALVEAAA